MGKSYVVWSTKYRRKVLGDQPEERFAAIVCQVAGEMGGRVTEVEAERDHVHLLAELPSTVELQSLVNLVKGVSSRLLRANHPHQKPAAAAKAGATT